jgi:N-methylhydantoinase A
MGSRVGVDVGGTFTDLVFYDDASGEVRIGKVPSTPESPDRAVVNAVTDVLSERELAECDLFLHGTTVGINAVVQRSGAKVGVLTTNGFRDVLEIRRTDREEFYNMLWKAPLPLVRRKLRLTVRERIKANGEVYMPLEEVDVREAARAFMEAGVESIAVIFINSHANPDHERRAESLLRESGFQGEISLSHTVTGQFREYERTSTTVIDAYIRPRLSKYLADLSSSLRDRSYRGAFLITRSGGGSLPFSEAERRPFETLASGPVAGAVGAAELSRLLELPLAVTADVGGTTFDTCVIIDGQPNIKYEGYVAGMPLQTTWVDVRSIGAGGGSVAYKDKLLLRVGPRSAGAVPGPVCYGLGGTEPTVTDAAATLGMLAHGRLAGGVQLDIEAGRRAVAGLGEAFDLSIDRTAAGIIDITTTTMAGEIRAIFEEIGEDPREASLVAFGGAGPLLATMIAREFDIPTIVVPQHAGNFSASGLLLQDLARAAGRTIITTLDEAGLEQASAIMTELAERLRLGSADVPEVAGSENVMISSLDLRYQGQEYSLSVDVPFDGRIDAPVDEIARVFTTNHERRYGHRLRSAIEIVAARITSTTPLPKTTLLSQLSASGAAESRDIIDAFSFTRQERVPFAVIGRSSLKVGDVVDEPSIILEETATTFLDDGFKSVVHPTGALLITKKEHQES